MLTNLQYKIVTSRWTKLKLWLFGTRVIEKAGPFTAVFYFYKGGIYLTRYDAL